MQYGYRIVEDMASGLMHFMEERGYNKLDEFIGCALNNIVPAEDLNRDFKICRTSAMKSASDAEDATSPATTLLTRLSTGMQKREDRSSTTTALAATCA